jgi:hypothetical protein
MTSATLEQLQGKRKQKRVTPLLRLFEDLSYLPVLGEFLKSGGDGCLKESATVLLPAI